MTNPFEVRVEELNNRINDIRKDFQTFRVGCTDATFQERLLCDADDILEDLSDSHPDMEALYFEEIHKIREAVAASTP